MIDIYQATKAFPIEERYGLQSQMRRAAVSSASNIVEGSARRSTREYLSFVNIAAGSAFETRYLVSLAARLDLLPTAQSQDLVAQYTVLAKSLVKLMESLKRRP